MGQPYEDGGEGKREEGGWRKEPVAEGTEREDEMKRRKERKRGRPEPDLLLPPIGLLSADCWGCPLGAAHKNT